MQAMAVRVFFRSLDKDETAAAKSVLSAGFTLKDLMDTANAMPATIRGHGRSIGRHRKQACVSKGCVLNVSESEKEGAQPHTRSRVISAAHYLLGERS